MSDVIRLASENYVNGEISNLPSEIFIATYGETTYEEVAEAYYSGKIVYLNINKDDKNLELTNKATNCIATLTRAEGTDRDKSVFTFVCDENGVSHHYSINYDTKKWFSWHPNWQKQIDEIENAVNNNAGNISKLLPLLASSLNSFRGGFKNTAGTLDIKAPGIYFIIQGDSKDKTITITQPGNTTEITKNGFIILAYDNGVGTVIGVSDISITNLNPISTGTYQIWSPDGTYHTEVSYSDMTVVAYLGNSNNDVGTWN